MNLALLLLIVEMTTRLTRRLSGLFGAEHHGRNGWQLGGSE